MEKVTLKGIAKVSGIVLLLFSALICLHVYDVTHRPPRSQPQRIMARIDLQQDINDTDAATITAWLYQQKGVDHVLCNAASNIAVFTFSPALNTADNIIGSFTSHTGYKAQRYMPATQDMMKGCPISAGSFTSKAYSFYKSLSVFSQINQNTAQ